MSCFKFISFLPSNDIFFFFFFGYKIKIKLGITRQTLRKILYFCLLTSLYN